MFKTLIIMLSGSNCITPLGQNSVCTSIYDCAPLLSAFNQRPLSNEAITFFRQSQCGFEGYVPRVCCGPMPQQYLKPSTVSTDVISLNLILKIWK